MKRGLIILGFLFILIAIANVSALPLCVQGGYMDALDCRFDDYSCQYAHRCSSQGVGTCLSGPCSVANFDEYSCKTTCSLNNGVATCYNCVWDSMTGMCNQAEQCEPYGGTFCLPGLRKCGGVTENSLRQFCDGAWTTEENCSANKMGVCNAVYNFETSTIDTSCIECDSDSDGFVPYRYSSLCPLCSGLECDCNDANANISPGKIENCTNLIDDNCNELVDNADPQCNQSVFTCSDSDNGSNIYVKGFILGTDFIFVDSCNNTSGLLTEYFCVNNSYNSTVLACPAGYSCLNGACNQSVIDNQSNATNCTLEGGFASELLPCCSGLSGFTMPDPETNFCNIGETITGGFLDAFLGLRHSITANTIVTEQVLCYDAAKGTPVCMNAGNSTEGWYYSSTGELIKLGICSSSCIELICYQGNKISCSDCRASFRVSWDAFKVSVQQNPPPTVTEKNASQLAADLIKQFEGFKAQRYYCAAGKPTIGYGHVITSRNEQFEGITLWDGTLTKEQAIRLLLQDAQKIAERAIKSNVKVDLNQNQYDALTSFIFNVGGSNFKKSTLLKYLNTGDYQKASNELPKWNKGGGKVLNGLVKRRAAEKELFDTPYNVQNITREAVVLNNGSGYVFNETHLIEVYNKTINIQTFNSTEWNSWKNLNSALIISIEQITKEQLEEIFETKIIAVG